MHEYTIHTPSGSTTVQLSDEDAAARGLTKAHKAADPKPAQVEEKAATPANKSRTAANKRAEIVDQAFAPKP